MFNGLYLTPDINGRKVALRRLKNFLESNYKQEFIFDIDFSIREG